MWHGNHGESHVPSWWMDSWRMMQKDEKIYWEKQVARLCAIHGINNLLQGAYFTEADFGNIAQQLDEQERKLMLAGGEDSADFLAYMAKDSQHVDESGNFSIEVIKKALQNMSISCRHMSGQELKVGRHFDAVKEQAFICNFQDHWITLRRMGPATNRRWFNLDSTLEHGPELISDLYLSLYLSQLVEEGYSIFLIRGILPHVQVGGRGEWFDFDQVVSRAGKTSSKTQKTQAAKKKTSSPAPAQEELSEEDQVQIALALSLKDPSGPPEKLAPKAKSGSSVEMEESDEDDDEETLQALALSLAQPLADTSFSPASEKKTQPTTQ
eukprot:g15202.t1